MTDLQPASRRAPEVGRWDNARFNAVQVVPQLLRGMFTRRPRLSALVDRWHPDPLGVRLVDELRRRYESEYLWLRMGGKPSLLVLDIAGVRRVLERSPDVYGPPDLKVRGMSHFQPDAVTVSTGEEWRRRRKLNEDVLGAGSRLHPDAELFLDIVGRRVDALLSGEDRGDGGAGGNMGGAGEPGATGRGMDEAGEPTGRTEARQRRLVLRWSDLHHAFRRITGDVVFGPGVESGSPLQALDDLMRRANRIVGESETERLAAFQEEIRSRLCAPEAAGLAAAACPHLVPDDPLSVAGQVPHWLFAMKDTLATNCAYALALIVAHREVGVRVGEELDGRDLADPESVNGLARLEGCLRDAMRLWPTTPLIVRKALRDDDLEGHEVAAGSQVVIHNGFNHRGPGSMPDPDAFHPDAWEPGVWDYRFNPMSNGPQACAGRELALFLGKAVLARLLQGRRWSLEAPELDVRRPLPHAFQHTSLVVVASGS